MRRAAFLLSFLALLASPVTAMAAGTPAAKTPPKPAAAAKAPSRPAAPKDSLEALEDRAREAYSNKDYAKAHDLWTRAEGGYAARGDSAGARSAELGRLKALGRIPGRAREGLALLLALRARALAAADSVSFLRSYAAEYGGFDSTSATPRPERIVRLTEARRWFEARGDTKLVAEVLRQLGIELYLAGKYRDASEALATSLEASFTPGERIGREACRLILSMACFMSNDMTCAREQATISLASAPETLLTKGRAPLYWILGESHYALDHYDSTAYYLERAIAIPESRAALLQGADVRASIQQHLGISYMNLGRHDDAIRALRLCYEAAREAGSDTASALDLVAMEYGVAKRYPEMLEAFRHILAVARGDSARLTTSGNRLAEMSEAARQEGGHGAVPREAYRMLVRLEKAEPRSRLRWALRLGADLAADSLWDEAEASLRLADSLAARVNAPWPRKQALRSLGRISQARGDREAALDRLRAANAIRVEIRAINSVIKGLGADKQNRVIAWIDRGPLDGLILGERATLIAHAGQHKAAMGERIGTGEVIQDEDGRLAVRFTLDDWKKEWVHEGDLVECPAALPVQPRPSVLLRLARQGILFKNTKAKVDLPGFSDIASADSVKTAEVMRRLLEDLKDGPNNPKLRPSMNQAIGKGRYAGLTLEQAFQRAGEEDLRALLLNIAGNPNNARGKIEVQTSFLNWASGGAPASGEEIGAELLACGPSPEAKQACLQKYVEELQTSAIDDLINLPNQMSSAGRMADAESLACALVYAVPLIRSPELRATVQASWPFALGQVLFDARKYDQCIVEYNRAAAAYGALHDTANWSGALANVALAWSRLGRNDSTIAIGRRVIALKELWLRRHPGGINAFNRANSYEVLADALDELDENRDALAAYRRAKTILAEETGGDALRRRASYHDEIGQILIRLGEYKDASAHFDTSAVLRARLDDPLEEARAVENEGVGPWNLGEYRVALGCNERGLFLRETAGDSAGMAGTLTDIGRLHWKLGEHDLALASFARAESIYRRVPSPEAESRLYSRMGDLRRETGEFAEAVRLYRRALDLRSGLNKPALVVETYNDLGSTYSDQTNYAAAESSYYRAWELQKSLGNHAEEARALENLSFAHFWLHDHARSLDEASRAIALWRGTGEVEGLCRSLTRLGRAHAYFGRWELASAQFEEALAIARKTGSASLEAQNLMARASLLRSQGRNRDVLASVRPALAIYVKLGDRAGERSAHDALGDAQLVLGGIDESEREYRKALELAKATRDRDGEGRALYGLSVIMDVRGDHPAARKLQEQALAIARETKNGFAEAAALASLAGMDNEAGRFRDAIESLRQALEMRRSMQDRLGEMDAHFDLARTWLLQGNYPEAIRNVENGLAIERGARALWARGNAAEISAQIAVATSDYDQALRSFDAAILVADSSGNPLWANSLLVKKGRALRLRGDDSAAVACFTRALADRRRLDNRVTTLDIELELGMSLTRLKRYRLARPILDSTIVRLEREGYNTDLWEPLYYRGVVERDSLKNPTGALGYWERAARLVEGMREQAGDEGQQAAFLGDKDALYRDIITTLLAQPSCADCVARAQQYLTRSKMGELSSLFGGGARAPRSAADSAVVSQVQSLRVSELALYRQREEPSVQRDPEALRRIGAQLKAINERRQQFVESLSKEQRDLIEVEPEAFPQLRKQLREGEVFLEPVILPDRVVVFVVRWGANTPPVFRTTMVDGKVVDATLRRLRAALSSPGAARPARAKLAFVAGAGAPPPAMSPAASDSMMLADCRQLYDWLIKPVLPEIHDATTLIVSPTGRLRYIPFGVLNDGQQFLAERWPIALLTNLGKIGVGSGDPIDAAKARLLAISNPDSSLAMADAEVDTLRALFGGSSPSPRFRSLRHGDATKEGLEGAVRGYNILHFATHGFLAADRPDSSFILLAGADPRLTLAEVKNLAVDVGQMDLVTLSACQTALGEKGTGREIATLAASFEAAGVSTVVASLWSVDDEGTMRLMARFYRGLKEGRPRAEALQGAQKGLLELARSEPEKYGYLAHPYYWAPFVVIGAWK